LDIATSSDSSVIIELQGAYMSDLTSLTAVEIASAVAERKLSATEVTRAFLARIDALNPTINAICTPNPGALAEADEIDHRLARGEVARPLEGVPFLVKDNLDTKGLRTTFGSRLMENNVSGESAICVDRLAAAGGVLLGKTNTAEFAHDINTSNLLFGTTRNPWDPMVTAGGSSGGSGAAVAAGFAPLAIGTDLGGSIRIPASFNNLVGIRPAPGRPGAVLSDGLCLGHAGAPSRRAASGNRRRRHADAGGDGRTGRPRSHELAGRRCCVSGRCIRRGEHRRKEDRPNHRFWRHRTG